MSRILDLEQRIRCLLEQLSEEQQRHKVTETNWEREKGVAAKAQHDLAEASALVQSRGREVAKISARLADCQAELEGANNRLEELIPTGGKWKTEKVPLPKTEKDKLDAKIGVLGFELRSERARIQQLSATRDRIGSEAKAARTELREARAACAELRAALDDSEIKRLKWKKRCKLKAKKARHRDLVEIQVEMAEVQTELDDDPCPNREWVARRWLNLNLELQAATIKTLTSGGL